MNSIVGRTVTDAVNPFSTVAMNNVSGNCELLRLGDRFRDLRAELDEVVTALARSRQPDFELEELEDQIRAQLYELSWEVANTSAVTVGDLKLKARIMSDRCDEAHADIIVALAQSISRDIKHLLR